MEVYGACFTQAGKNHEPNWGHAPLRPRLKLNDVAWWKRLLPPPAASCFPARYTTNMIPSWLRPVFSITDFFCDL